MRWVKRLAAAALMLVALGVATSALAAPDFEKMSLDELRKYAAENKIELGAANSKKTMIAVIEEGLAAQEKAKKEETGDFKPPPREWFRPKIPDLSDKTVPGRVANVGRLILGGFGVGLLGYALWRFLLLASQALSGKKTHKQLLDEGIVLVSAFAMVLLVLGGMMYSFLAAVLEFFMAQT